MKSTQSTYKVLAVAICSLFLISLGASLHQEPSCTGDSAHCSQNDQILENNESISNNSQGVDQLETDISNLDSEVDSLRQRLSQDEVQVTNRLDSLDSAVSDLDSRVSDLESDHVSRSEFESLESEFDSLQSSFQSERDRLEQLIQDNSEDIQDLNQSTYSKTEVESLLSEKYDRDQVDDLVNDLDSRTYDRSEVENILSDADQEVLEKAKEYSDSNEQTDFLGSSSVIGMIKEFFQSPNNFIKNWVEETQASDDRVDELEERINQLEVENRNQDKQLERIYEGSGVDRSSRVQTALGMMRSSNISEMSVEDRDGKVWNCEWQVKPGSTQKQPVCVH